MADNQLATMTDVKSTGIMQQMKNTEGVLDATGMGPFAINMGGKPYIQKAGLSIKLQQYANKHNGVKSILSIPISYSTEDPKEMKELFALLPEDSKKEALRTRDNDMAMFTTPSGTALVKCIILFGDGLKVSEIATANVQNVKMSTIHTFLDVMAATRAYNRCVKKITGDGFMNVDLVDEFGDYNVEDFADDSDCSFRDGAGAPAPEGMGAGMEYEAGGTEAGPCVDATAGDEAEIREDVQEPQHCEEIAYINKAQQSRLFKLGSTEKVKAVLEAHGYSKSEQIPKAEYASICREIEEETSVQA